MYLMCCRCDRAGPWARAWPEGADRQRVHLSARALTALWRPQGKIPLTVRSPWAVTAGRR